MMSVSGMRMDTMIPTDIPTISSPIGDCFLFLISSPPLPVYALM